VASMLSKTTLRVTAVVVIVALALFTLLIAWT
jgi:hypothetical protein